MHEIADAADAAWALKPLASDFALVLFAIGLINAALLSAAILPLTATYKNTDLLGHKACPESCFHTCESTECSSRSRCIFQLGKLRVFSFTPPQSGVRLW